MRFLALLAALAIPAAAGTPPPPGGEAPVVVRGYDGDLMEPFVTRDGRYLIFNNNNTPPELTDLHIARSVDPVTFDYFGPLAGTVSDDLDGVASVDRDGTIYWTATKDYFDGFSVIHRGRFASAAVTGAEIVPGLARGAGWLQFDAEISDDGGRLYLSEGYFGNGRVERADIYLARRKGAGFAIDRRGRTFAAVNTRAQEYAPALSRDERVLIFTRWRQAGVPRLWIATRRDREARFGRPREMPIPGYVEAASFSPDETLVYFHRRTGNGFRLFVHGLQGMRE
jgi:hypothetical protein